MTPSASRSSATSVPMPYGSWRTTQRTRQCFRHLHLWRWRGCPWLIVSPEDTVEFHIRGYTVTVENAALGQAIAVLPIRLRDVALLYYFAGMSDPQIGQLLRLKPDTVQHRRAASLAKLRKLLGGSYGQ